MYKKNLLFTLFAVILVYGLHAQHDVMSTGGDYSSAGGSVAFSIGQVSYTYQSGESGSATLGVQQPNFFNIVATEDLDQQWDIQVYPNPADQFVYIDLKNDEALRQFQDLHIRLFDVKGNLVSEKAVSEIITSFPLSTLTDAVYILQIGHHHQTLKSFKLYKSN